jgi:general secretion pathway protein C
MFQAIMQAGQRGFPRSGPQWISLLLGVLILAECIRVVLPLPNAHASEVGPPASMSRGVQRRSGVDVGRIVGAHLFGVAVEDAHDPTRGSPTTANLVLQGTIATADPRSGLAIVTADSPAKLYKVGDELGGASLHSVYLDHIVLNRGGRFETLSLPRLRLASGNVANSSVVDGAAAPPTEANHGPNLADLLRAEPSVDDESNRLQGFRIRPGRNPAAFIRSGLKQGDLVTAVNGTPLAENDRQRGQKLIDTMLASGHATVSVVRNGVPVEVSVENPE